jgi:acetyl-CoA carboxylase carboxyl transferase subunit alpha
MDLDFEQPLTEIRERIAELTRLSENPDVQYETEIAELRGKLAAEEKRIYSSLTPWQIVQVARHADRPVLEDFVDGICSDFIELHGDRCFGDDPAMRGGFATIDRHRVMLIGMSKGKTVEDKVKNNFGMANPEGYRKALRLMRLAMKYRLPVVCLVDTPAAYPGKEAEERGQAEAIARNITEMAAVDVPIVVVVTGEGGSGGALGIAVGDVVLMLAYAIYSVIPPEGCAAILWRDAAMASRAAEALKLTADSLLEMGIIDEIVPEPFGGAHRNYEATFASTKEALLKHLRRLKRTSTRKLLDRRFDKYARIGKFDSRKYANH